MVDSYRIMHVYFVDATSPEFKAPWNPLVNIPRVYTPEDQTVQTPNSDTPYSMLGMELCSEPLVLTVPQVEKERYFSIHYGAFEGRTPPWAADLTAKAQGEAEAVPGAHPLRDGSCSRASTGESKAGRRTPRAPRTSPR